MTRYDVVMDSSFAGYLAGFRARRMEAEARASARTHEALARLPEAARILREEFGALRVGVFGSLVTSVLSDDSDVDLYVDSIQRGRYWQAVARLRQIFRRPVDLIELVDAPDSLQQCIAEDGVDVA